MLSNNFALRIYLFELLLMFVVSSFIAGAGDPSRTVAVHKISSVIWVSYPFCIALLRVCIFCSASPLNLGCLGCEVIRYKFGSIITY